MPSAIDVSENLKIELKRSDWLAGMGNCAVSSSPQFPAPGTVLAEVYGLTTGRRSFDPYSVDWETTIKDDRGRVRLHLARSSFLDGSLDQAQLTLAYEMWVKTVEYGKIDVLQDGVLLGSRIIKLPKRGNDVYRWKIKKRLSWLNDLPTYQFFNPCQRDGAKKTRALFITLTYDPKLADLPTAWAGSKIEKFHKRGKFAGWPYMAHVDNCPCISCSYNRWITGLRKKFGEIAVYRVWESFESGYPHVHLLLLAKNFEFSVVFQDKQKCWRIRSDQREKVREGWNCGFVDVVALYEIGPRLSSYMAKYMAKAVGGSDPKNIVKRIDPSKVSKNLAMLWVFRKRAYSISGDLRPTVNDLISNGVTQTEISAFCNLTYVWRGVFTAQELGFAPETWFAWLGPPGDGDLDG